MKASLLALGASKEAFMYWDGPHAPSLWLVVSLGLRVVRRMRGTLGDPRFLKESFTDLRSRYR
ncbi:hypothetical protein BS329_12515 [Amycolatopsis coloradensis]|uniref:Uncharacterized protein n=1 Tax=Amycolatopsis coloradensis TaxID=76021 RepID=A0A1R0KX50_9PSEU|nr:hypothetical protein BS329_12515 [Amycolatopsis coloradensis]